MKTLFNSEAVSKGGRSGSVESPDKLINVTLGNPLVKGQEKRGPNPELLFAGAYALYCGVVFIATAGLIIAPIGTHILHRFHLDKDR